MRPEDLTAQIRDLDAVPAQCTGNDRLHKQIRLIDLKAHLVGRGAGELERILAAASGETLGALQRDVRRARAGAFERGGNPDEAFERAVSTIERLMTAAH